MMGNSSYGLPHHIAMFLGTASLKKTITALIATSILRGRYRKVAMNQSMLDKAYQPLTVGPSTLPNRFIKAGANENMSSKGRPTRAMRLHHEELAQGGVGMTTMAYVAVEKEGRTLTIRSWIHDEAMPDLKAVTDAVHRAGSRSRHKSPTVALLLRGSLSLGD